MEDLRALPPGWIREVDSRSGVPYYVNTAAPNPQPVWEDPRPAYHYRTSAGSNSPYPPYNPTGQQQPPQNSFNSASLVPTATPSSSQYQQEHQQQQGHQASGAWKGAAAGYYSGQTEYGGSANTGQPPVLGRPTHEQAGGYGDAHVSSQPFQPHQDHPAGHAPQQQQQVFPQRPTYYDQEGRPAHEEKKKRDKKEKKEKKHGGGKDESDDSSDDSDDAGSDDERRSRSKEEKKYKKKERGRKSRSRSRSKGRRSESD
ncbi:hypothetical protein JCM11251_007754 [Rhodosporidiobolus azoricus]